VLIEVPTGTENHSQFIIQTNEKHLQQAKSMKEQLITPPKSVLMIGHMTGNDPVHISPLR
jgi:hypothetical protein